MIKIENMKKSFADTCILKDINLSLNDGEIGVITGKSGAGKTTLIRCINGLEDFDFGKIYLDKLEINKNTDREKIRGKVGLVFQNFNLFPHMTVLENIIIAPTMIYKENKDQAIKKAKKLLDMVDLSDKAEAYPFQLSGGQKQRVAIARACALSPSLLCFDEPTSALDEETAKRVVDIIKKFAQTGMTVLIITHDLNFADMIKGKKFELIDGRIYDKKAS
jgi:polar amino acid transport system ATP-binding protein